MKYKIGICQFNPVLMDVKQNITRMEKLLTGVKADLIVLPELAASGYLFKNIDEVRKVSENAYTGVTANLLKKLAAENNSSYVAGIAEKYKDKLFNSAILVNPDGEVHLYRKIHLFNEEKNLFSPGDLGFRVFKTKNDVPVGLMVCFDWIFPESARTLMLKGAQIIAHSANLVLPWCQRSMITRSIENRLFTATANRTGTDDNDGSSLTFTGMSQITTPKGEIIYRLNETEEKVVTAEIDLEEALNKNVTPLNHVITDRRSEYYYQE
jgi:predicted amidohydrolase